MIEAQKRPMEMDWTRNIYTPMWVNKSHYYYADRNFYNFPYAFGLLFSKGLYAKYLQDKEAL